jgi:hypothetical protein
VHTASPELAVSFSANASGFLLAAAVAPVGGVTVVDVTDTSPQAPLGCPVEVVPARVAFSRRGVGTVRVACPNGCVTRLSLYIDLRRPHQVSTKELDRYLDRVFDTRIANATLRLAPSQEPERVTVKLVRPAFALLRRHHRRLRVFAGLDLDPNGAEIAPPAKRFVAVLR